MGRVLQFGTERRLRDERSSGKTFGTSDAAHEALHPGYILGIPDPDVSRLMEVVSLVRVSNVSDGSPKGSESGKVIHAVERQIGIVVVTMVQ